VECKSGAGQFAGSLFQFRSSFLYFSRAVRRLGSARDYQLDREDDDLRYGHGRSVFAALRYSDFANVGHVLSQAGLLAP